MAARWNVRRFAMPRLPALPVRDRRVPLRGRCRILGLALLLALLPGAALAHASLVASQPPEGAVLADPPAAVTLDFDAPVRPLVARLTGLGGETWMLPAGTAQSRSVRWTLPPGLARGGHLLSWRVTAEDGHPIAGATLFSLGEATALAAAAPPSSPRLTRIGVWASRAAMVGAVLFAVGGAAFAAWGGVPVRRRAALAGLAVLPAAWGFRGLDLLGLGPAALAEGAPWDAAAAGAPGAALGLIGATLLLALGRGAGPAVLALAGAGVAAALSGHAAPAPPQLLMRPAVALNVIAAALWIGALVPLASSLRRGETGPLRRFSAAAPWGVALLLLTRGPCWPRCRSATPPRWWPPTTGGCCWPSSPSSPPCWGWRAGTGFA